MKTEHDIGQVKEEGERERGRKITSYTNESVITNASPSLSILT